jgi:hypothetical protein
VPAIAAAHAATLALSWLGACAAVDDQGAAILAAPIAIPIGDPDREGQGAQPHDYYYESVVTQLQRAWLDRDRDLLARLLDTHERRDAPQWAREQMVGFRRILRAMEFETLIADRGGLDLPAPLPSLGEPLAMVVRLGPLPGLAVRLLGGDHPARARFMLVLYMFDRDAFGTEVSHSSNLVVDLPADIDFAAGDAVELPVAVEVDSGGSILRRIEVAVLLMPGHVEIDGVTLPNRQVRCARGALELLPRGHEPIEQKPLASLLGALRLADAAHYPHVYLAARQLARAGSAEDRATATAALIDRVRLGSDGQARSAMAALALLQPDATVEARDRTTWLQWWARHAPSPLRR